MIMGKMLLIMIIIKNAIVLGEMKYFFLLALPNLSSSSVVKPLNVTFKPYNTALRAAPYNITVRQQIITHH